MNIPLPFPYCNKCKQKYPQSYHGDNDCDGLLEINPSTEEVYCTKCGHHWNIWNSHYRCRCGNTFHATEVKEAVDELIEDCQLCAEELMIIERARSLRIQLANQSADSFISGLLNKLGFSIGRIAGYTITKIFEYIKSLFI